MKKEKENQEETELEPTTEETPETPVEQPEQENKESLSESTFILINTDITERKLAEQRYKALFDSSADAIMTLAPPTWQFTSANKATIGLFGAKDEAEFITKGPGDVSPKKQPDGKVSANVAKAMIMKAMKEGSAHFDWTHMTLQGKEFQATVLLTKVKVGEEEFLQATVRDVSEEKQAENDRFAMIQNIPGMVYNAKSDWTTEIVANSEIICGYSAEELSSNKRNWLNLIHKDDKARVFKEGSKVTKKPTYLVQEYRIIDKNGNIRWVSDNKSSFFKEGKLEGISGVVFDITEKKKTEEKYEAIVHSVDAGIVAADPKTKKFLFANKGMEKLTGYSEKELINMNVSKIHPKKDLPKVFKAFKAQMSGKIKTAKNLPVKKKGGGVVMTDISSTPEQIGGKKVLLGIFKKSEKNVCPPVETKKVTKSIKHSNRRSAKHSKKHKLRQIKKDLKKKPRVKLM
jgi:PAS domain S-box-containing protein